MLTGNKGNSVRHGDDSLPGEHFVRDHRIFAVLPLPDHKGGKEEHADDELGDYVAAFPGMRVPPGLEGDQAGKYC
jgi:hypothetical protein